MFNHNRLLLLLPWCLALLFAGCGQSPAETETMRPTTEYYHYDGLTSMEELIVWSDVVARVRLILVDGAVVVEPGGRYRGALEFRFRVLEYLMGRGGSEIVAVTIDEYRYDTEAEARAAVPGMVATRDTRWDDAEAIVLLLDYHDQDGRTTYLLGGHTVYGEDGYTVASRHNKSWLPEAATTTSSTSRSTNTAEKRFLLDAPSSASAQGLSPRSGSQPPRAQTESAPTITLGAFKAKVAELEAEVAAGDGSEDYRECVYWKYFRLRILRSDAENGRLAPMKTAYDLGSGLAAGGVVYEDFTGGLPGRPGTYWLEGRDKDLFTVETTTDPIPSTDPLGDRTVTGLRISTTRPLAAGDYTFVSEVRWGGWICRTESTELERRLNRHTRSVHVTAPPRTLHEALFDPVDVGSAVGADSSNGVLKPADFSLDGTTTTMSSLKWEDGAVTMTLSPAASLADYAIDFIDITGTTTLSLTSDNASTTPLTWTVPDKPWSNGDLLMMRMRRFVSSDATLSGLALSGVDLAFSPATTTYTATVPATTTQTTVTPTANHGSATYVVKLGGVVDNDGTIDLATGDNVITVEVTAEDTTTTQTYTVTVTRATPSDHVTITLIPRVDGLTFFDIDIQWSYSGTCENYFVAITTDTEYMIRSLGFHPPQASSHYVQGGWLYDSVPDFWVVVQCRGSGETQEVGRASLRAAHPDNN